MEKYLSIGEVSRLLDIPQPTLRFWQEKGIFSISKDENNYRKYTMTDLVNIAEIAFYRNIGMPVKQMERFDEFNLEDYKKILGNKKSALEEKIRMYHAMCESIQLKEEHIKNIEELKNTDFIYGKVPFSNIVKFEYSDRKKLIQYTRNPSLYVRFMDTHNVDQDVRGIIAEEAAPEDILLWKKKEDRLHAIFLIEEIPSENYKNNIPEKLSSIHQSYDTGILLANYLLSETVDGRRIDYLKGYAELLFRK